MYGKWFHNVSKYCIGDEINEFCLYRWQVAYVELNLETERYYNSLGKLLKLTEFYIINY